MKISLVITGFLGFLFFSCLFGLTFGIPDMVAESAKGFIKKQIEKEVKAKYLNSKAASLSEKALMIAEKLGYEEKKIIAQIKDNFPKKIAAVIASLCGYDCEKKKALAKSITAGYMNRIADIKIARKRLGSIIRGKYLDIVRNLLTDLRIFLGSNASMFIILIAISFLQPKAIKHLFLPALLLLVSTLVAATIYVLGQDWFYTILYNDYMGFGYLIYIGTIFGFFLDIVFNRAKVTTWVINGIFESIGSALTVTPC